MEAIVHPDGRLIWRGQTIRCALGQAGVRVDKEERDGATPAGLLPLRRILYRGDRVPPPRCAMPVEPIAPTSCGWSYGSEPLPACVSDTGIPVFSTNAASASLAPE